MIVYLCLWTSGREANSVGWQALALNGLLYLELTETINSYMCQKSLMLIDYVDIWKANSKITQYKNQSTHSDNINLIFNVLPTQTAT